MKRTVMYDGMKHFANNADKTGEIVDVLMEWMADPANAPCVLDFWCRAGIILQSGPGTYRLVSHATA